MERSGKARERTGLCDEIVMQASEQFGTPFYIYDISRIRQSIGALKECLDGCFDIALSIKANPNPNLLKKIIDEVEFFDVASLGEIALATMAGVKPEKMLFTGPGKSLKELESTVRLGIGCVVVESLQEALDLEEIAGRFGISVNVALRINPDLRNHSSGMRMGGAASQFGVDESSANEVANSILQLSHLNFVGIHCYFGTQFLDADKVIENFQYIFNLSIRMQKHLRHEFDLIDFGGGFGVPYFQGEDDLDLSCLRNTLPQLVQEYKSRFRSNKNQSLLVESGRYIFAESGWYCASVLYQKFSKGKYFSILDGGSNFHSSLSGLGKLLRRNFPFHVIYFDRLTRERGEKYDLVGPLCTPADQLAFDVEGAPPERGDIVVFEKSGAYGLTFSQINFLSHLSVSEIGYDRESLFYLKKPKTERFLCSEYVIEE